MKSMLDFLRRRNAHFVLAEIGASGDQASRFEALTRLATQIRVDADSRDFSMQSDRHNIHVDRAIIDDDQASDVTFYLTKSPHCSSTLRPRADRASAFIYGEGFELERTEQVPATSLRRVLAENGIDRLDWLKMDTQGTDLRLYRSVRSDDPESLLAVEVEPGLYPHYDNADLFPEIHATMLDDGYWLADLQLQSALRMRASAFERWFGAADSAQGRVAFATLQRSPTAPEALYLRSLEALAERVESADALRRAWAIALTAGQIGYACEVCDLFDTRFGRADAAGSATMRRITRTSARGQIARAFAPHAASAIRRRLSALRSV